jgi:hypothetical protein
MKRLVVRLTTAAIAIAAIACSQAPTDPSPGSPVGPGSIATLVDVPLSVDVTEGLVGTWNWAGQSVTTPPGAGFGNVRFAWYHYNPRGETTAFGRIYVLDREFLGVPGDLSPSMPGFLARSEPEASGQNGLTNTQGSEYTLPESLVLAGNTRYWFYTDKQGAFATSFDKDVYADGNLYVTGFPSNPFRKSVASGRMVNGVFVPAPPGVTTDANFRLRGIAR